MKIQKYSPRPALLSARTAIAFVLASCFAAAQAAPGSPLVVNGQATFQQQGNVFSITNTPGTVINWQSFSVNAGDVTRFIQQSGDSAVLNRIVGQDPSQILGALQSNGHVFLINPNGILFGRDARVDVNGLTASTLALSDADFLAGKNSFKAGAKAGGIVNQGSIGTPSGGKVFLIASNVSNSGIITSPQGQVVLAAGHSVQLADASNPALHVVVSAPASESVNLGQVIAQGGKVGIYGALVNQRGVVIADSAQVGANGKIVLRASRDAFLDSGSVTTANGAGSGGQVSVEGERVGMLGNASIDASGASGGGTVLLGGGYQGRDPLLRNAQQTLFGKNASIRADATGSGNGGTVVVWGDGSTRALGQISAQGGALAGDGGLVETSGKHLDVNGIGVRAGARNGANGTWLLDPYDVIIDVEGFAGLGDADEFADPMSMAFISASTLNSVAAGTNVILQATHDVKFAAPVNPVLGSGSLRVEAGNSIYVDAPISTGGGALTLTANYAGYASQAGQVVMGAGSAIKTGGGDLTMSGTQVHLAGPISTSDGHITVHGGNMVQIAQDLNTGNGNLMVNGSEIIFGGSGIFATTGTGSMHFHASGKFELGQAWQLASAGHINVNANAVSLSGSIGPALGLRPIVSFGPASPEVNIDIITGGIGAGLMLDPVKLAAFDAEEIFIGGPEHTGNIRLMSEYGNGLANRLALNTSGNIVIAKPITMPTGTNSTLDLHLHGSNHLSSITTFADVDSAQLMPGGRLTADNVFMHANNMSIGASITAAGNAGGHVSLSPHMPTGQIALGAGAADSIDMLGLLDTELALISAQSLYIGGNHEQAGAITITAGGVDLSSSLGSTGRLHLNAGQANLTLNGNLTVPGGLFLEGNHLQTAIGAYAKANMMLLSSSFGIGTDESPFNTEAGYLAAANARDGGVAPINISNTGPLRLGSVHQIGIGNAGSISIANGGAMTVLEFEPMEQMPLSMFESEPMEPIAVSLKTGKGAISLKTTNPLTLLGNLSTESGNILLVAGNGGLLTIGATSTVSSDAGHIGLTGGDIDNGGRVFTGAGDINLATRTVSGDGVFLAPGGSVNGMPVKPQLPTLTLCLASPEMIGCAELLKAALDACIANPAGPECGAVLPSLKVCIAAPATAGCGVVLPTLAACTSSPALAGCSVVLPTLSQCTTSPSLPGCGAVLPTLAQCVASPSLQGCAAVLPTLAQCVASPSLQGCAAVLPTLAQCVASPSLQGCAAVLPPVSACVAAPTTPGCHVITPPTHAAPGSKLDLASQETVKVLDAVIANTMAEDTAPEKQLEKKESADKRAADIKPEGEKRELNVKTYCN